jgi:hypothetical protein
MENTNTGRKSAAESGIKLDAGMPCAIGSTAQQHIGLLEGEAAVINIKRSRLFSLLRTCGPAPANAQVRAMARRTSRLLSDARPVMRALRAGQISDLHNGPALEIAVRLVNLRIQWDGLESRYLAARQRRRGLAG